jgi:hypothetical protein
VVESHRGASLPQSASLLQFTSKLALAVTPGPVPEPLTGPVTLFLRPTTVAVTLTPNEHAAPEARPASERLMLELPDTAEIVPPPHEPESPFGLATASPVGRASLNPTPVSALELKFWRWNVSVLVAPTAMALGPKAAVKAGGAGEALTSTADEETLPVPAFVDVTGFVVLVYDPATAPVTVTVKLQVLDAGIVLPDSVISLGGISVTVPPPHMTADALGTVRPTGNVSVKDTPVRPRALFGLEMMNWRPVVVLTGILFGLKDVDMVGASGADTARVADPEFPVPALLEVTALVTST